MASTGKIVELLFESVLDEYNHQMQLMDLTDVFKPNSADMQNTIIAGLSDPLTGEEMGGIVWRPVQQHAPVITGWDLTGLETDIIEETYPARIGVPRNDFFEQRADDLRDMNFWERRGRQSGMRQATELNRLIAQTIVDTGSIFYRSSVTSGYEFIAEAQAILNERQVAGDMRYFMLNDRDNLTFGSDLAARQTLQGRPEQTWKTGQIGQNVAEFDVYTASFLPTLAGGTLSTTTTAAAVGIPQGGTVTATGVVTNVDYREFDVAVTSSAGFAVGDRVTFTDSTAANVNAVGLADKTNSNQLMTFCIVAVPDASTVTIFPKPIPAVGGGLTTLQAAYANTDIDIDSGSTMTRANTDASERTNIFWTKESMEITAGDAPIQLLNEFAGQKVIREELKNGLSMYMAYDGNIDDLTFKCRLFTWYGITNKNPMANGCCVTF